MEDVKETVRDLIGKIDALATFEQQDIRVRTPIRDQAAFRQAVETGLRLA